MYFTAPMLAIWQRFRMAKFYAVFRGRKAGVYTTWNDCKKQVDGFKGCIYKSFAGESEAKIFAKTGEVGLAVNKLDKPSSSNVSTAACSIDSKILMDIFGDPNDDVYSDEEGLTVKSKSAKKRKLDSSKKTKQAKVLKIDTGLTCHGSNKKIINDMAFSVDEKSNPVVYTDGACSNNGKKKAVRAGYGVWWGENHPLNISARLEGVQTNQRAEIAAANACIKQAVDKGLKSITIRTDSMFIINCITKWVPGWLKKKWIKSDGKPVVHKPEFMTMLTNLKNVDVKWEHVRGHQGIYGNEMADRLAVRGATM
ncbi:ribonuclease H1-like [Styela clava]|uniref:ribonuclease H1-like n=1 Tax=Styela clava TaxID=7725 RepID=UPI001939A5D9|nr:ribonuclease H1-like [Styela clava]